MGRRSLRRTENSCASRPGALWVRRVGWLVLIWVASVAVLGVVALVFRAVMTLAGMTP